MKVFKDICYSDIKAERNKLDLYIPDAENFPVYVHFHGGGIESGDKSGHSSIGEYLAEKGIAYAAVNYRMYPSAVYPDFLRDAAAAVAWTFSHISEYGKAGKVFVGGNSAGAYMSMMLCFDNKYLAPYKLTPMNIAGFVFDGPQPTTHFNVLRERGIDSRRAIIDEAAPLYYFGLADEYPPMTFICATNDMAARLEQIQLCLATLKHFGYDESKYDLQIFEGTHGRYATTHHAEIAYKFIEKNN